MNQGNVASPSLSAGDDSNSSLYRRLLVSIKISIFSFMLSLFFSATRGVIGVAHRLLAIKNTEPVALIKNGKITKPLACDSLLRLSEECTRSCGISGLGSQQEAC